MVIMVMKNSIRKDSAIAQLNFIRLLIFLATFLSFGLGMPDIKGAYLHGGSIKRTIYVRLPTEWSGMKNMSVGRFGNLANSKYGIAGTDRQWQQTVESWMLKEFGRGSIIGLSQLFVTRNDQGPISLNIAKVTDDLLCGGSIDASNHFMQQLDRRFDVRKVIINEPF